MPYVGDRPYDAFVCFADEDNAVLPGAKEGWVDTLTNALRGLLGQLGVPNVVVGARIPGNVPADGRIEALGNAAVVVIVLSPACLRSPWLTDTRVRERLLATIANGRQRTFVVAKLPTEGEPSELRALRQYAFWKMEGGVPQTRGIPYVAADDTQYYNVANDLAVGLAAELKRFGVQGAHRPAGPALGQHALRVFLAEGPQTLFDKTCDVRRRLEQAGIDVLPHAPLPDTDILDAVRGTLAQCGLFVQLLDDNPEFASRGSKAWQQLALAEAAGLPLMQWRDPSIALSNIIDPTHRDLVLRCTVRAESITNFCEALKEFARTSPSPLPQASDPLAKVFVDVVPRDTAIVREVERFFSRYPRIQWDWSETKLTLKNLKFLCGVKDGVIVYWGNGDSGPTQRRYEQFLVQWKAHRKPGQLVRIVDGPPSQKPPFQGANWPVICCRDGGESLEFRKFVSQFERDGA
jgi:hypothetical protein